MNPEEMRAQAELLEGLCRTIIVGAEIEPADIIEKENFRAMIEQVARSAITEYERSQNGFHDFPSESVQLKCFGSLSSGFATKAADMDLGLLSPLSRLQPDAPGSPIPRIVEKAFLDIGLGARLLTRTRVPIIKICEKPPAALRQSLLEEREKWEKGGPTEHTEEDEVHEEPDQQPLEEIQTQPQDETLTREQRLQSLKQGKYTLPTHYVNAKRLLRKLGGRDLTNSNIQDFKDADFLLVNEVCLAFVDGLTDAKLRERMLRCRSLNRYDLSSPSNARSLLGVFTQAEGEMMAMLWESRLIPERDAHREEHAESSLRLWERTQNKPDFGRDPLGYQKELLLMSERLKKMPSIQLLVLTQSQHESAAKYFYRAKRLLNELGGNDSPGAGDPVLPAVVQHYVKGIYSSNIRAEVAKFAQSLDFISLRDVARRHGSLQLAEEYDSCLQKGIYSEGVAAKVQSYIELLRAPMAKSSPGDSGSDNIIPVPPDSAPLVSEILLLGDPSRMTPNQPRDRYNSSLEFPKSGVGVQCDINFSAHLALHNTLLLRCYSHCDPRVRPLVLFVKHWAKVRRINTPYRGTLSSYGYVLMVLHYLVNVAQPFVLPNLQLLAPPPDPNLTPQQIEETVMCKGRNVQFWRDEAEIQRLARENALTQNREPVGQLLRGFFEYYAKGGNMMSALPCRGFDWGRDVISLRTPGGLVSKQQKGWTGAKTVVEVGESATAPTPSPPFPSDPNTPIPPPTNDNLPENTNNPTSHQQNNNPNLETKEVRYRYLFAIEDPFELDHNVARTVTHAGIVSIRDEFRRAWRIIRNAGKAHHAHAHQGAEENLLEDVGAAEEAREREGFERLVGELHGLDGVGSVREVEGEREMREGAGAD